ncbi:hypothetical protein QJS66_10120 [Kocuria rhizophila]|nr:hypothetical protein QJS66_10120 [Kocuria rhizophila]
MPLPATAHPDIASHLSTSGGGSQLPGDTGPTAVPRSAAAWPRSPWTWAPSGSGTGTRRQLCHVAGPVAGRRRRPVLPPLRTGPLEHRAGNRDRWPRRAWRRVGVGGAVQSVRAWTSPQARPPAQTHGPAGSRPRIGLFRADRPRVLRAFPPEEDVRPRGRPLARPRRTTLRSRGSRATPTPGTWLVRCGWPAERLPRRRWTSGAGHPVDTWW